MVVMTQMYKVIEVNNHSHGATTRQRQDRTIGTTTIKRHGGKVPATVSIKKITIVTQIRAMVTDPMKNGMLITPGKEILQERPTIRQAMVY